MLEDDSLELIFLGKRENPLRAVKAHQAGTRPRLLDLLMNTGGDIISKTSANIPVNSYLVPDSTAHRAI
jgi:hypothetical protein